MGTANCFTNPRAGAATNPDPEVFSWATVVTAMNATHQRGENYVLWGGREG